MEKLGFVLVIFVLTLQVGFVYTQPDIQQILEQFYEETGKYRTIDEVEIYLKYPLELKKENASRLSELLGVNKKIARKIVTMSNRNLDFEKICDSLNLLSSQCELLKILTKQARIERRQTKIESDFVLDLKSRVYTDFRKDTSFLGDNLDSYQKITIKYKNYYTGFSISKDVGEPTYFDNQKYYFSYRNNDHQVVLGKFLYKSFWGNVLGEPFGLNKGSNPTKISYLNNTKLKPTTSSIEYGVFNGLAFLSNFEVDTSLGFLVGGFVSSTKRSGRYDSIERVVTSVYTMDYFRDSNELKRKNVLNEKSYFFQFATNIFNTTVGYSIFVLKYDKPILTNSKKFIQGDNNLYHSIFLEQNFTNLFSFSSEISFDREKNLGVVGGAKFNRKGFSTTLNVRYFSNNFRSPFGSILGENSYPNNELGLLFSTELYRKGFTLQFYADFFKSLTPTYLLQVPVLGNEEFLQFHLTYYQNMFIRARIKREEKTDYIYNVQKTNQIPFQMVKYSLLLQNKIMLKKLIKSSQRFDYILVDNQKYSPKESGIHLAIDSETIFIENLNFGIRCNYFSTVSYNSAIYFFDIVAPEYMYSIPFYGTGYQITSWANLNLLKLLNIYIKYFFESKEKKRNFVLIQLDFNYSF